MKLNKFRLFGLIILSVASLILIQFSCNKTEETENEAPTCTITNPDNGDEIQQGETLTISADADDTDGYITEVRFFVDNSLKNTSINFPYSCEWNTKSLGEGNHIILATAIDNEGEAKSDEITISVLVPPSPPTNLECTGMSYNFTSVFLTSVTIYLKWDSSPNSNGYKIYSSTTSGSYHGNPVITTTSTSANKTYPVYSGFSYTLYFVATAFNDGGESEYSNEYQKNVPSQ